MNVTDSKTHVTNFVVIGLLSFGKVHIFVCAYCSEFVRFLNCLFNISHSDSLLGDLLC